MSVMGVDQQQQQQQHANPKELPLNELQLKVHDPDGVSRLLPAMDMHWAQPAAQMKPDAGEYICLLTTYGQIKTDAALAEWQFKATQCEREWQQLLSMQHHVFWSTMVYQPAAINAVVTFLQHATPFYRIPTPPADNEAATQALAQYEQLLLLVVRVICRLLTQRETPEAWLSASNHGELLYANYLITVPMLFDLVIALGNSDADNAIMLKQLFSSLFSVQANYLRDIQDGLAYFEQAFASIQTQVDNEGCEGAGGGAVFDDGAQTPYDDVVLYTLDCAYTLCVLLDVCPQVLSVCEQLKLPQSIASFYDNTLPALYKYIYMVNVSADALQWLNEARQQYLNAFRTIANYYVEESAQPTATPAIAHKLVELLTECLSAQAFVVDYQRHYPVEFDMEILQHGCAQLKEQKISFVVNGYQKALSADKAGTVGDYLAQSLNQELLVTASSISSDDSDDDEDDADDDYLYDNDVSATAVGAAAAAVAVAYSTQAKTSVAAVQTMPQAERDLDLEVIAVLDVLPDLGTGFVRRLLVRYDNSEQAIAAIFDENLPPDLANSDRSEVYIPLDPQDKVYQATGVRHLNVYDGDAYDIMTQDQPKCIIKQGKGFPGAAENVEQLLDDKQHVHELKERYQQYALVEDNDNDLDDETRGVNSREYDDEYDDSYDALFDGHVAQPFNKVADESSDDDDDTSENDVDDVDDNNRNRKRNNVVTDNSHSHSNSYNRNRNNQDFCENPEVVRARYAARQQAKWGNTSAKAKVVQAEAVTGTAKGQGQSKETLRSRSKKEAHKSSRANHNRKAGAAFKRGAGMLS